MSSADILVNGKTALAKPLTMNIATNEYLQAYWNTMSALAYNFKDDGCDISRNEFDNGTSTIGEFRHRVNLCTITPGNSQCNPLHGI